MITKGNVEKALKYYASLPYTIIIEPWDDGQGTYYVARVAELPTAWFTVILQKKQ